jgi:hypothetical protein
VQVLVHGPVLSTQRIDMKSGLTIKKGRTLADVVAQCHLLAQVEVLVGFPEETTGRNEGSLTNATLGYIHDNGAPESNIPQRKFMEPGIESAKPAIIAALQNGVRDALSGGKDAAEKAMHSAGLAAVSGIKNFIDDGVAPALAESTLRARARRGNKGAIVELGNRKDGKDSSLADAKPLVDTGQLRNAVNYAIRPRARRK